MIKFIYVATIASLIVATIWLYQKIQTRGETVRHLTTLVASANKQAPGQIEEHVMFVEARREKLDVVFQFEVTSETFSFDYDEFYSTRLKGFREIMCETPKIREVLLEKNVKMINRFVDINGQEITRINFSIEDCYMDVE